MPPHKLPGTLKRSPAKAQRTYLETLKSAEKEYGDGERAHRTALASLKHSFEKVGDHWEPKKKKGPSDPAATRPRGKRAKPSDKSAGGVDVLGNSKKDLLGRAKKLGIKGRSKMTKLELGKAIARKQD